MRPYRYRSLPSKPAVRVPAKIHQPTVPKAPESIPCYGEHPVNATAIFLLASCLQSDTQEDIQRLYAYLPPQAQSVASAAITVKANSAQLIQSARIRAAIARHDGHARVDKDPRAFWNVMTQTNVAKTHHLEKPIAHTAGALDDIHHMHQTLSQLNKEGSHAFLSRHLESRLKQSLGGMGPLLDAMKNRQPGGERRENSPLPPGGIGNPLMSMLLQGSQSNPMLSMLMQGSQSNPLMSMLLQGGQGNPLMSMLLQGGQGNPLMSTLMRTGRDDSRGDENPLMSMPVPNDDLP